MRSQAAFCLQVYAFFGVVVWGGCILVMDLNCMTLELLYWLRRLPDFATLNILFNNFLHSINNIQFFFLSLICFYHIFQLVAMWQCRWKRNESLSGWLDILAVVGDICQQLQEKISKVVVSTNGMFYRKWENGSHGQASGRRKFITNHRR